MIKTRFIDELGLVVHIGSEEIDLHEVLDAAGRWQADEHFGPDIPVVWDLVGADLRLDWEALKSEIPEAGLPLDASRSSRARTAWVVADELTEIVVESISLAFPWTTNWKVFKDADEAVRWARRQA